MDETTSSLDLLRREKARLRQVGVTVLVLGLVSAGLVYWMGKRGEDARLNEFARSQARSEARQLELMYGKSGDFVSGFYSTLKRPDFQAIGIAVIAGMIAGGCFYLGQPWKRDDEPR